MYATPSYKKALEMLSIENNKTGLSKNKESLNTQRDLW